MEIKYKHLKNNLEIVPHQKRHVLLDIALTKVISIYKKEIPVGELDKSSILEFASWHLTQYLAMSQVSSESWAIDKRIIIKENYAYIDELLRDYIDHLEKMTSVDLSRSSIKVLKAWAKSEVDKPTPALEKKDKFRVDLKEEEALKQALPK